MLGGCVRNLLKLIWLCLLVVFLHLNLIWASVELPYWKQDLRLFDQIRNQRTIAARVMSSENDEKWNFAGGGHIQCDLLTSWRVTQQFEKLNEMSWLFRKVQYETSKQRLHIQIHFMGFERFLSVQLSEVKVPNSWRLKFRVYDGFFQGLEGTLEFLASSQTLTEADLRAEYFGIIRGPKWVFVNAAEFAMHYVATRLRNIIEKNPC